MNGNETLNYIGNEELLRIVNTYSSFVLTTHVNPDGDALGSEYALMHFLLSKKKKTSIINTSRTPDNLAFMNTDGWFEKYDPKVHRQIILNADVIFILDLNSSDRLRSLEEDVLKSGAKKIVIDHHLDPRSFADGYLVNTEASATAEIIFDILESDSQPITKEIAEGLYIGIMTDTGSFRFERTTPKLHRIAARLIEAGVNPTDVYRRINDEYPMKRSKILGLILSKIESICGGRATIMTVSDRLFRKTETSIEDIENFVNYGLSIAGVEVTALLAETGDGVKISFRSRGDIFVNGIAKDFGGGGHAYASGAMVKGGTLRKTKREVAGKLCKLLSER